MWDVNNQRRKIFPTQQPASKQPVPPPKATTRKAKKTTTKRKKPIVEDSSEGASQSQKRGIGRATVKLTDEQEADMGEWVLSNPASYKPKPYKKVSYKTALLPKKAGEYGISGELLSCFFLLYFHVFRLNDMRVYLSVSSQIPKFFKAALKQLTCLQTVFIELPKKFPSSVHITNKRSHYSIVHLLDDDALSRFIDNPRDSVVGARSPYERLR